MYINIILQNLKLHLYLHRFQIYYREIINIYNVIFLNHACNQIDNV